MRPWLAVILIATLAGCFDANTDNAATKTGQTPPTPSWLPLGANHPTPLTAGTHTHTTFDYEFGETIVGGPDASHERYEYEAMIRGVMTLPDGPGPYPLAVFLHGQHTTCAGPDGQEGGDCSRPYRNDKGYLYLMEHLASHGIATASILAHEINRQNGAGDTGMWARGELVLATIQALKDSSHAANLDFTRIGLMGHSRGGEGVVTAVEVNQAQGNPHNLSAVIALAPTDFARRSVPSIPFLTLAPYCDGDVYSLHGLRQFDQSRYTDNDALKIQLLVMGANHNNYNTQWGKAEPGPMADGNDAFTGRHMYPHCDLSREDGGGRMTLQDTYAQAIFHMGGFLRWTLLEETGLAPYFLGQTQPNEACPASTPCPGATHLSVMTPGRQDLFWADENGLVGAPGVTTPPATTCNMNNCDFNVYSSAWMAELELLQPATLQFTLDDAWDLRHAPQFNVRIAIPTVLSTSPLQGPPTMHITFHDATQSHTIPIDHPALFVPPALPIDAGTSIIGSAKVSANAITLPIPEDMDRGNITGITLEFSAQPGSRILVADAWFNRETANVLRP